MHFSEAAEGPQKVDTLRELGEDGSLVDPTTLVKELGWPVGQTCRPKKDHKFSGIITEITKDVIKVDLGQGVIQKLPVSDFESGQWVRFTAGLRQALLM